MLNYEFPPLGGGAANATYYILKEFSKFEDLEIDLVTSSVDKSRIEKFSKNIKIHYLDIGKKKKNLHYQSGKELLTYSWRAYWYSWKLKREKNFDLIHAFFGIPCGFLAMMLFKPYIVSLRGSDVPFYNERFKTVDKFFFRFLSWIIWRFSKKVIANSKGLKELATRTSNCNIGVIYNGIDILEFKPKKSYSTSKTLKIISVGRLIERKGFKYLLEALKGLDNVSLSIVGGGPLREELSRMAEDLGVDVKFYGEVSHDKMNSLYNKHDIFILPSLNEGMSNTVLEAMASGLPLVLSDVGGSRELVDGNGFIVRKGYSNLIREKIERYLKDRSLVKKHSVRSRELAERMSWEKVASEYAKEYGE